jgi:hypothetical protein
MAWYILIALAIAVVVWIKWGARWWNEYTLYRQNKAAIKAVEGAGKIYGDIVGTAGELMGVANSLTHGGGNFFSRATGAFSQAVG